MTGSPPRRRVRREWHQFAAIVFVGLVIPGVLMLLAVDFFDRVTAQQKAKERLVTTPSPAAPNSTLRTWPDPSVRAGVPSDSRSRSRLQQPASSAPTQDSDEEAEAEAHRPHPPKGVGSDDDMKESGLPPAIFRSIADLESRGRTLLTALRGKVSDARLEQLREAWRSEQEKAQLAAGYYRLERLDERGAVDIIQGADRAFTSRAAAILGVSAEQLAVMEKQFRPPAAPSP